MATKVIFDVDTGSDDAVAVMCGVLSKDIEVLACCTVWGNLPVANTTENTLRVLEALGRGDIPVYTGCDTAMVKYLCQNRVPERVRQPVYNEAGKEIQVHYAYLEELKPAKGKAQPMDAPSFYVDFLRHAKEPVTLVPVGPLTNLGFALQMDPSIVKNIERIVLMGGSDKRGGRNAIGESNIWHDAEAAAIVMNCGADITVVPLDATFAAAANPDDVARLRSVGTFAASFAATLIAQRIEAEKSYNGPGHNVTSVHDALALCAVIDPTVLRDVRDVRCDVGLADFCEGATLIDRRCIPQKPNCHFAMSADHDKLIDMFVDIFSNDNNRKEAAN